MAHHIPSSAGKNRASGASRLRGKDCRTLIRYRPVPELHQLSPRSLRMVSAVRQQWAHLFGPR